MKVSELLYDSRFRLLSTAVDTESKEVSGLYVGDLLSFVMSKAKQNEVWLTVQTHPNIIAIASLLELSAIVVVEGVEVPQETIELANEKGVVLIVSILDAVQIIKRLEI